MKTIYITNLGHESLVGPVVANFHRKNDTLPIAVQHEKLYQAFKQILLLTFEGDGYGFYEGSEDEGRKLEPMDPVGAMTVRIDYDSNHEGLDGRMNYQMAQVFDMAIMALNQPNSHPHYPEDAVITCIRVYAKVDDDVVIEHTYWPTQFDLVPDLIGGPLEHAEMPPTL